MHQIPIPLLGPEIYADLPPRELDLFGWNSHHPIFAELIRETAPETIIEVGTWKGASAIHMADLTRALGTRIFCVDTWIGGDGHIFRDIAEAQPVQRDRHGWPGVYYQFLHNVKASGFTERISPVPFMSLHASWLLEAHQITAKLIYIDGGHHYLDVVIDLHAWSKRLAPGGILFGDDFQYPGVSGAIKRFLEDVPNTFTLTSVDEKWILRRAA